MHAHQSKKPRDIPRPSSISSSASWKEGFDPGMVQGDKLTPIVPKQYLIWHDQPQLSIHKFQNILQEKKMAGVIGDMLNVFYVV